MKLLINTSKYLDLDLISELGKIPSAFVPVGGQRLFTHIFASVSDLVFDEKWISIPSDYELTDYDQDWLNRHSFHISRVEPSKSLAESVNVTLSAVSDGQLLMLHGDTLCKLPELTQECIFTAKTIHDYGWKKVMTKYTPETSQKSIWAGAFYFDSTTRLSECIAKSGYKFEIAVENYFKDSMKYVELVNWLDFSHVNTFFDSRKNFLQARAFNSFQIKDNVITKVSSKADKLKDEYNWFKSAPNHLRHYLPATYGSGHNCYSLEYLPLLPLNEIFILGCKDLTFWSLIMDRALQFTNETSTTYSKNITDNTTKELEQINQYLFIDKLKERYNRINWEDLTISHDIRSSINDIYQYLVHRELYQYGSLSYMHGDFCLSNIMFDMRNHQLKVIDPRGSSGSKTNKLGNINYDIAKLAHSFIGNYDGIVHSSFEGGNLELPATNIEIAELFQEKLETKKYQVSAVITDVLVLFISMVPLHYDNPQRQTQFLTNVIKLNEKYSIC